MSGKDNRIVIPTGSGNYRIELFTKNPKGILSIDFPALKLGNFRMKRADNPKLGERYYISDLREDGQLVDVIVIHDDESKRKIRAYGLTPVYQCGRLEVYKSGFYQTHNLYTLNIDTDGVRLANRFD